MVEDPVKFSSVCALMQTKKESGEILFGLSYLPTAQRLSFSIVKINNIKVEKKIGDETLSKFLSTSRQFLYNCLVRSLCPNPDVQSVGATCQEEEDHSPAQHEGSSLQ